VFKKRASRHAQQGLRIVGLGVGGVSEVICGISFAGAMVRPHRRPE
jgi:hypothetical protein